MNHGLSSHTLEESTCSSFSAGGCGSVSLSLLPLTMLCVLPFEIATNATAKQDCLPLLCDIGPSTVTTISWNYLPGESVAITLGLL